MDLLQTELHSRQSIQLRAYYLWQSRGCPFGTPEVDWFMAEEQAGKQHEDAPEGSAIIAAAEAIGSALGSVASVMASVDRLVHSGSTKRNDSVSSRETSN